MIIVFIIIGAAEGGHTDFVDILLDRKVPILTADRSGQTAFVKAVT